MALIHIADGAASAVAAVAAVAICGVPSWFTFWAIRGGIAPTWAYAFVAILTAIGLILGVAFARKAAAGIGPAADRRR